MLFLWSGFVAVLTASLIGLHSEDKLPTLSVQVQRYAYLVLLALFALGGLIAALLMGVAQFSLFSVFPALAFFVFIFVLLPVVSVFDATLKDLARAHPRGFVSVFDKPTTLPLSLVHVSRQ